jgi:hypothetical protein
LASSSLAFPRRAKLQALARIRFALQRRGAGGASVENLVRTLTDTNGPADDAVNA